MSSFGKVSEITAHEIIRFFTHLLRIIWAVRQGWMILFVAVAGFIAALVDSLLGATIQVIYHCPVCEKETEHQPQHLCGGETTYKRGLRWLNNDMVNAAASIAGGIISAGLAFWLI